MTKKVKTFKVCVPANRDNLNRVRGWLKSVGLDSTYLKEKTWVSEAYFTFVLYGGVLITGSDSNFESIHFKHTFAGGDKTPILNPTTFFSLEAGEYPKQCEECGVPSLVEPYGHQKDGLIYACKSCTYGFEIAHGRKTEWCDLDFDTQNPFLVEAQRLLQGLHMIMDTADSKTPVSEALIRADQDRDTVYTLAEALYAFKERSRTTLQPKSEQA